MADQNQDPDELKREIDYYKRRLNELAGESLKADYLISGLRKRIRQTQQAFELLSHLPQIVTDMELSEIFEIVLVTINTSLGMDKTVILMPTDEKHNYRPTHWTGFTEQGRSDHGEGDRIVFSGVPHDQTASDDVQKRPREHDVAEQRGCHGRDDRSH